MLLIKITISTDQCSYWCLLRLYKVLHFVCALMDTFFSWKAANYWFNCLVRMDILRLTSICIWHYFRGLLAPAGSRSPWDGNEVLQHVLIIVFSFGSLKYIIEYWAQSSTFLYLSILLPRWSGVHHALKSQKTQRSCQTVCIFLENAFIVNCEP